MYMLQIHGIILIFLHKYLLESHRFAGIKSGHQKLLLMFFRSPQ